MLVFLFWEIAFMFHSHSRGKMRIEARVTVIIALPRARPNWCFEACTTLGHLPRHNPGQIVNHRRLQQWRGITSSATIRRLWNAVLFYCMHHHSLDDNSFHPVFFFLKPLCKVKLFTKGSILICTERVNSKTTVPCDVRSISWRRVLPVLRNSRVKGQESIVFIECFNQ